MAEPSILKDHQSEAQIYIERVSIGALVVVLLFGLLLARVGYLQFVRYDAFVTRSDENRMQLVANAPSRGLIFDSEGSILAENLPARQLVMIPEQVLSVDDSLNALKKVLAIDSSIEERIRNALERRTKRFEAVTLMYNLTDEEVARFEANRMWLPGFAVRAELLRHYPEGALTAHAVGSVRMINSEDQRLIDPSAYVGTNHIGKLGVERFYEDALLGGVGFDQVEVNAKGRVMKVVNRQAPKRGDDLTLYLNTRLQKAADQAMGDRRGAVVAMEPASGGVLALLSKPSYDPNPFMTGLTHEAFEALTGSIDVPLFNRALQGQYEPGSTLKPFIGLVGLVSGHITTDGVIDDPGWFRLEGETRLYRDWNWTKSDSGGHGHVHIQKALYRSCNVYFYDLAHRMGIDLLSSQLRLFGFGQNLSVDLPESKRGLLPDQEWKQASRGETWRPGDTVNLGIGQGDMLVTPLQMAQAVSTLANRGKIRPAVMVRDRVRNHDLSGQFDELGRIPDWAWGTIIDGMRKVVHRGNQRFGENGTAWAYIGRDIPYAMAGKSGTAQVVGISQGEVYDEDLIDERLRKHAWFIAFAPVDDPLIAVAVLLENGGGGSENAAPVARAIIDAYLMDIVPSSRAPGPSSTLQAAR